MPKLIVICMIEGYTGTGKACQLTSKKVNKKLAFGTTKFSFEIVGTEILTSDVKET